VVRICRRSGLARATPWIAALLLSVAQEVKRICCGSMSPNSPATMRRARATAWAVCRAGSYIELGLKYSLVKNGIIASYTSGATGVVALLSA